MTINALKTQNLILLDSIAGSHAYGTAIASSDEDHKGVFILPRQQLFGLQYIPQVSDEKNDNIYYEIGRFVELLTKSNPTTLEMLAAPKDCILLRHALMDLLPLELFISKLCEKTFAGFAIAQIKKAKGLNKKIVNPVDKKRRDILDFCFVLQAHGSIPLRKWLEIKGFNQRNCGLVNITHFQDTYAVFHDEKGGYSGIQHKENSTEVSLSSIPKDALLQGYLTFNKDAYKTYCKDYRKYWEWVENRNEARYENTLEHGKNYDAKNMLHTMRLLDMAEEIALTGQIQVRRPNRDFLLEVRSGKFEYDDLVQIAEEKIEKISDLYQISDLQEMPDAIKSEEILIEIRERWYASS